MTYTDLNKDIDLGSSGHLIEFGGFKAMVDCGLHPKKMGLDALPELSKIIPESLDFIAITHAHIDHCGALPVLGMTQTHADILLSEESRELVFRLLKNSRNVMARQRDEHNIKEYPLYEFSAIDALRSRVFPMPYFHSRRFDDGDLEISFYPSGHIAGAASVMFEYKRRKILFSGDISFHSTGILKGATPPEGRVDTLVVETTRCTNPRREGTSYNSELERLVENVSRVVRDGGSVLIPAFALGRMQEVLQILQTAKAAKKIPPETPVFATGLGVDLAEMFVKLSKKSTRLNFSKQYLDGVKSFEREIVPGLDFDQKGIYILGSGMMVENTPAYRAASAIMDNRANAIFFVGYSDPETPGGKLLSADAGDIFPFPDLNFEGRVNCKVDKFDLTSHAEREELLNFILEKDPRNLILTHGSEESREWMMTEVLDILPKVNVIIPEPSESVEL